MKKVALVGIDYSMTSPAMTLYIGDMEKDRFDDVDKCLKFFSYTVPSKMKKRTNSPFIQMNKDGWNNYMERWSDISDVFINQIFNILRLDNDFFGRDGYGVDLKNLYIALEGYSYGSNRSLIFNIAENTGILKYKFYQNNIKYKVYQPTSVKKFITGKGNSKKDIVYDSICERLDFNLSKYLNIPLSDSVLYDFSDSLSICFMLYIEMLLRNNLNTFVIKNEEKMLLQKKDRFGYSLLEERFIGG